MGYYVGLNLNTQSRKHHASFLEISITAPFKCLYTLVHCLHTNSLRFYWVGQWLQASATREAKQAKFKKISELKPRQYLTGPSKWLFNVSVSMLQESCFSKCGRRRTDERNDEILLWLVTGQGLVAWHKHSAQTVEVKQSLVSLNLVSGFFNNMQETKKKVKAGLNTTKHEYRTITLYTASTKLQKMGRTAFINALLSVSSLILDPVFSLSAL